jgi:adenylate kinase
MTSSLPNILITGTPGVGKTTTSQQAAERTGLKYVDVSKIVKNKKFHHGVDEDFESFILDEDKLCDYLEKRINKGGCIVDFHSPEIFPDDWFDLVLVLRSKTDVLFDRLSARGYSELKRNENMECEIMQVVLDAATDTYDENIVHEVQSNTAEEMESNIDRVVQWLATWKRNNT